MNGTAIIVSVLARILAVKSTTYDGVCSSFGHLCDPDERDEMDAFLVTYSWVVGVGTLFDWGVDRIFGPFGRSVLIVSGLVALGWLLRELRKIGRAVASYRQMDRGALALARQEVQEITDLRDWYIQVLQALCIMTSLLACRSDVLQGIGLGWLLNSRQVRGAASLVFAQAIFYFGRNLLVIFPVLAVYYAGITTPPNIIEYVQEEAAQMAGDNRNSVYGVVMSVALVVWFWVWRPLPRRA